MVRKGLSAAALTDRAKAHLPEGGRLEKDNLTLYMSAKRFPNAAQLMAICAALEVQPEHLLPLSAERIIRDNAPRPSRSL